MSIPVAFLLGAGFAAPFGVPTMGPFLSSFRDMTRRRYPALNKTLDKHLSQINDDGDLEALLSSLGKAERLLEGGPPSVDAPPVYVKWQGDSRYLRSHLISHIIERCERFDRELARQILVPSVMALCEHSKVGTIHFFTTNYDRIVEYACEEADVSFADGFGSGNQELVAPWNRRFSHERVRIYKLHGSVSYYVDQKQPSSPTFLRLDRGYPLPGPEFRLSMQGRELEPLMVVPALEKDALGDPYGYLNHVFADTLAEAPFLIAIGTSLRDNHIVSAINYNADSTVVLFVDLDAERVVRRMPSVLSVVLKADARKFFQSSIGRLMQVIGGLSGKETKEGIYGVLRKFAVDEAEELARVQSLTEHQQEALRCILVSEHMEELLSALHGLRGVSHESVAQAIGGRINSGWPVEVRKAATSCLVFVGGVSRMEILARTAREDSSAEVRLEAYLALESLGTEEATAALAVARGRWEGDAYFRDVSS